MSTSKGCRGEDSRAEKVANLDFEARVPVPFSIFPRTYKETEVETTTHTHEEVQIDLPAKPEKAGREGQYSSISASAQLPPRQEQHFSEEEVRITREEERYRRPGAHSEHYEEHSKPHTSYSESHFKPSRPSSSFSITETSVEVDRHQPHLSSIDRIEREYRARAQSAYKDNVSVADSTVDPPRPSSHFGSEHSHSHSHSHFSKSTVDPPKSSIPSFTEEIRISETTVDPPKAGSSFHRDTEITEETVEYPQPPKSPSSKKSRMGYYDSTGHHHSLREGLHKMADRVFHSEGERHDVVRESHSGPKTNGAGHVPNTVTIPCHHIRMGDILILQGRPCQVIRISTSSATGQHRYLGVDLFTKQLHEESSFVSNPAPSVVVQTMRGPVFKQYRVLDIQDGTIVAMTETGDVKTGVPVIDQSNLWSRLTQAFNAGHGSVRVLVLNDGPRELVVDMKVIHASSL
ncbi:uncharacterized protein F4812DRAFT_460844 [Daldinia caldariorum]|uniref:uncharacterized protein n=1 Tax=Daldinia caldariorum TaxID=326644 RepID=UPI002008E4DE|nr:uncharacterized protein F4812DRAFT_460844 [Daldinia caldariorum]KAI1466575.1 hypothetical protein F4812DRAFT_460844 [Daldinia caldariorum]